MSFARIQLRFGPDLRSHREKNNELPNYLREDKDNTVPVDAIPIPQWIR